MAVNPFAGILFFFFFSGGVGGLVGETDGERETEGGGQ